MKATSTGIAETTKAVFSPEVAEVRAIAKDAYIYGFPFVDSYRIQYSHFVDRNNPEFKASWNQIFNNARVYTPHMEVPRSAARGLTFRAREEIRSEALKAHIEHQPNDGHRYEDDWIAVGAWCELIGLNTQQNWGAHAFQAR